MATTSAERQAKYRARKREASEGKRLDCWLSTDAHHALARLARHQGVSTRAVLEALILTADKANLEACATDEEFEGYLSVTR